MSFQVALTQVLDFEGGFTIDDGGPTNYGVTQDTYNSYRFKSVRDISSVEVADIYQKMYWLASKCDQIDVISAAMSEIHFDCAVNCGIGSIGRKLHPSVGADELLQRTLGVTEDGVIGPITMLALKTQVTASELTVINKYLDVREAFYKSLANFPTYGASWLGRLTTLRRVLTPGKV